MPLTLYGSAQSRTMRVLWCATELQLELEHVPWGWDDPRLKQPEFLRLNPAGAIPTLVDDGFALSESLAINLYLARKYGAEEPRRLWPASLEGEAEMVRWSLWAQGHLEPWVQRDALLRAVIRAMGDHARAMIEASLSTLDRALARGPWLYGDSFSVADLNVAGVLSPSRSSQLDFSAHPRVHDWLDRCYARPACVQARERYARASAK